MQILSYNKSTVTIRIERKKVRDIKNILSDNAKFKLKLLPEANSEQYDELRESYHETTEIVDFFKTALSWSKS